MLISVDLWRRLRGDIADVDVEKVGERLDLLSMNVTLGMVRLSLPLASLEKNARQMLMKRIGFHNFSLTESLLVRACNSAFRS